jgi:hypothetical protein
VCKLLQSTTNDARARRANRRTGARVCVVCGLWNPPLQQAMQSAKAKRKREKKGATPSSRERHL